MAASRPPHLLSSTCYVARPAVEAPVKLGIDFGTTNSAVSVCGSDGVPRTLELFPGERVQRTVIYASPGGQVSFGNRAFREYVDNDLEGRFLRSLKAFLPQNVPRTTLAGKRYTFEELITSYLLFLVGRANELLAEPVTEVVVGRPVRFHVDPERDASALKKLQGALKDAGLGACRLVPEPVAAAHFYERELPSERTVLVGDFGGGTSDFAVLRVGPNRTGNRLRDVLATTGVARAGDFLDGRFMDTFLLDFFGRGASITARYTKEQKPWSHPITRDLQKLYYLHLLRSDDLAMRLDHIEPRISDPRVIRRIRKLVFDDLGYPMAWAIEGTKRSLSDSPRSTFRFDEFYSNSLDIETEVDLDTYEAGSSDVLEEYREAIDEALQLAGLSRDDIHDVFLTGGTAQLPFIRGLFAEMFGAEKLQSGDSFTSVCDGLALS